MLGPSITPRISVHAKATLRVAIGETSGDIPVYSLHKIKNLFRSQPPAVDVKLQAVLLRNLILANQVYQEESGNKNWSCLTSKNLCDAFETTDHDIATSIDLINDIPKELAHMRDALIAKLHEGREKNVFVMKQWFETNFDALHYDMSGKVPWSVVCRLRRDLGRWIAGAANPFDKDIDELVLEVAAERNIVTDFAEDAWKRMGGKIFKNNR